MTDRMKPEIGEHDSISCSLHPGYPVNPLTISERVHSLDNIYKDE